MDMLLSALAGNIVWVLIGTCFLVGMVLKAVIVVFSTASQERSRREIAAYVAEGTMTPQDAERLIRADVGHRGSTQV